MTKNEILIKIQERKFDFKNKEEVFKILEENIDRIEFIKDHLGLRDVLFIAEKMEERFFVSDFFGAFNVEVTKEGMTVEEQDTLFQEKYVDDPDEVLENMKKLFNETNRKLFVGIGFIETTLPELRKEKKLVQDQFGNEIEITKYELEIYRLIHSGTVETEQEAAKMLRKFPDWFNVNTYSPEEVEQVTIEDEEKKKTEQKINILKLIDVALDNKNENDFYKLAKKLKEI